MDNAYLDLLRTAELKHWCVKPYCTTCGAVEYRVALANLAVAAPSPLFSLLIDVTEADLSAFPEWRDALWLAFMTIPTAPQTEQVLTAWSERPATEVRLTDFVIFRIIRKMPPSLLLQSWIDRGVAMAVRTGNFSLTESLVLVLGAQVREYPDLLAVAEAIAADWCQMRRVMRNALRSDARPVVGNTD